MTKDIFEHLISNYSFKIKNNKEKRNIAHHLTFVYINIFFLLKHNSNNFNIFCEKQLSFDICFNIVYKYSTFYF